MAKFNFKNFNPSRVQKNIDDFLEKRMRAVGALVRNTAVKKLNKGQPIRRTKGGNLIGLAPSKPGEPPRTLTGRLKQSVSYAINRTRGRVAVRIGTNVVYGRRLELGFHGRDRLGRRYNQEPRPWLRPSVTENRREIGNTLRGR